jgi:hypothetical protein
MSTYMRSCAKVTGWGIPRLFFTIFTFITMVILVNMVSPTMVTLVIPSYPDKSDITDSIRKSQRLNSGESASIVTQCAHFLTC